MDACNAVGRANVTPLSATLAGLPAGSCTPSARHQFVRERISVQTPGTSSPVLPKPVVPGGLQAMSDVNSTYNGLAKVDYHPNDKNTLSGMFFIGDGSGTWNDNPSAIASHFSESLFPVKARVGSGSWTFVPNSSYCERIQGGLHALSVAVFIGVDHNANPDAPWGISGGIPTGYDINTGVTNPLYFGLPTCQLSTGFTQLGRQLAQDRRAETRNSSFSTTSPICMGNTPSSLAASTATWKPLRAPPATPRGRLISKPTGR